MNELRLLFDRRDDALTYRLVTSWGGDAGEARPFTPFLKDEDYEALRWYLEDYMDLPMGGAATRAQEVERKLGAWGRQLYQAIFDVAEHREVLNVFLDGEAPRVLTLGTKDLEVLRLPWELIADVRGPLSRRGVTLRRQLESAGRPERYDAGKLPLRILLVVSRPDDAGFIDPRHTTRAMLAALEPLGSGVAVDFCRPATLERLTRMLDGAARPYQLVHFDGHGTFLRNSQIGALCARGDAGEPAGFFGRAPQLHRLERRLVKHRAVLLNAWVNVGRGTIDAWLDCIEDLPFSISFGYRSFRDHRRGSPLGPPYRGFNLPLGGDIVALCPDGRSVTAVQPRVRTRRQESESTRRRTASCVSGKTLWRPCTVGP